MVDIRYHIYSLAAVFLALAVGIVIGSAFARSYPSSDTGRRTIARYEQDMRVLKAEIVRATEDAGAHEATARNCLEFCRAVLPVAVKDKLAWRNVALVQTGDADELTGAVRQALELAGAKVTSVTRISPKYPFDDRVRINSLLASGTIPSDGEGLSAQSKLLGVVAAAVFQGKYAEVLEKLEQAGVADFSGDYYRLNKLVVLVGGASGEGRADRVDTPLIQELQRLGASVVGCEATDAEVSYVPKWRSAGISTVDNADQSIGQLALIYALRGEKGSFGLKPTADRLFPQTLETR